MHSIKPAHAAVAFAALLIATQTHATDIGRIKFARGSVTIERGAIVVPVILGTRVQLEDRIRTGPDGSVGITMDDDSLLSAGPNSILSLDRYAFDPTTNQGHFDTGLNKGTLTVVSGRIARNPGAMTIRTPGVILGVRGTSFAVSVDD